MISKSAESQSWKLIFSFKKHQTKICQSVSKSRHKVTIYSHVSQHKIRGLTYHLKPIWPKRCSLDESGEWPCHKKTIYLSTCDVSSGSPCRAHGGAARRWWSGRTPEGSGQRMLRGKHPTPLHQHPSGWRGGMPRPDPGQTAERRLWFLSETLEEREHLG